MADAGLAPQTVGVVLPRAAGAGSLCGSRSFPWGKHLNPTRMRIACGRIRLVRPRILPVPWAGVAVPGTECPVPSECSQDVRGTIHDVEERNCAEADLPSGAPVVRFRRRVDAAAVLRIVEPG